MAWEMAWEIPLEMAWGMTQGGGSGRLVWEEGLKGVSGMPASGNDLGNAS